MSNKLFKSIFAVAMVLGAAFGFASCTPQDEPAAADPKVEVSKTALTFSKVEGSDTLDVTATAGWKTEIAVDWVTVAPATGNGNKTITVSVSANDTGAKRETVLKVHAIHPEYGNWDTKKVTIIQSANEDVAVEEVALYSDDFDGKEVTKTYGDGSQYPYIDQFPEFVNKKGEASANVTYTGSGVSVRSNEPSNNDKFSTYVGSGVNNIFFGKNNPYFRVNNIAPLAVNQKNYKITFGLYKYDPEFSNDQFILSISKDGNAWSDVEYAVEMVEHKFSIATAEFTLTAGVEALYIKFEAKVDSTFRIDDLKFSIGNGGQTIELDSAEPAKTITIAEALAVGQGNTINGAIEGIVISNMDLNNLTSKRGMYVQDETGALQFYLGANHTFAFGTKVRIDLTNATLGSYNGAVQVSGIGLDKITTLSTGNTVEPKSVTMADYLANKYEGQYIALDGVQVIPSDLTKTWGSDTEHTSIYMEDAEGNQFVVFSSKYATYRGETVAQGSGTIKGISSINEGKMQIIFAQATDYAGLTGERFTSVSPEPEPEPEPTPAPVTPGAFTSDAAFVCSADDSTNAAYTLGASTIGNEPVSGFKLGKGKQAGKFTSAAVGVSGNKYLNFYAVGWKGGDVTLYYRVDGGATMSQKLDSNSTATGNPPYANTTALSLFVTDHYSVLLEGLTETSTIEFSTDANFALTTSESTMASARAIVCGVKLTDEPIDVENPGTGEQPENPDPENPVDPEQPTPGEIMTIAEALAVGNGNTIGGIIEGVVVSNLDLNNLTSKKGIYVQDETGALQFYLAANHEFAFGTKVRIDLTNATLGAYNGAVQVSGVALDKITTISTDNTVEPKSVTMADFLANKYEGQYIALEGVQVAAADLAKTWVVGGAHTSINIEDANGNKFVVFSSKYATYGTQTVAQGSGTIKGISSINNGTMQLIFAQATDFAGMTGERFGDAGGEEPEEPGTGDEPSVPEGYAGRDDFNTVAHNSSYIARQSTAGWVGENCAVQSGGAADANPVLPSLLGSDTNTRAWVINGKTSAVGKITSPVLTTGCGTLKFTYGMAFSDKSGYDFDVEIMQNGEVVKSFNVKNADSTKYGKFTFEEAVNVAGEFQIVITNNCPSATDGNKDRVSIWDVMWTAQN